MADNLQHVGLFGGSFNPPHLCHLLSSLYCLETSPLDEVWWIPVGRHPFAKDRELAPFADRLEMCKRATACFPRLKVSQVESERDGPSFTIDLLDRLETSHPQLSFTWIIGSDILDELPLWHRWTELRTRLRFLVVGRGEAKDPPELPEGGQYLVRNFRLPDIGSSSIRRAIGAGESVHSHVQAAVLDLIKEKGLYGA